MKDAQLQIAPTQSNVPRKVFLKIGRPGYRVTKIRDPDTRKEGLLVLVHLPNIKDGVIPRRRFMSAWGAEKGASQQGLPVLDCALLVRFSCVVSLRSSQVAAEPYETITFRIPAREIEDEDEDTTGWNWTHWDPDTKQYNFQFMFRSPY